MFSDKIFSHFKIIQLLLILGYVLVLNESDAQTIRQDYLFKDNDTIFGFIHGSYLKEYDDKNDKFITHSLRKVDSFVLFGKKFKKIDKTYSDGIYDNVERDTIYHREFFINHEFKEKKVPDYYVTHSLDTIKVSKIYKTSSYKFYYKTDSGKEVKLKAKDIHSIHFDNQVFKSLKRRSKNRFYQLIIKGEASLYKIEKNESVVVPIPIVGVPLIVSDKNIDYYILSKNNLKKVSGLTNGVCKELFMNEPVIYNKMKKYKLQKTNLQAIVDFYNKIYKD